MTLWRGAGARFGYLVDGGGGDPEGHSNAPSNGQRILSLHSLDVYLGYTNPMGCAYPRYTKEAARQRIRENCLMLRGTRQERPQPAADRT